MPSPSMRGPAELPSNSIRDGSTQQCTESLEKLLSSMFHQSNRARLGGPPFGLSERTAVENRYVDSWLAGNSAYLKYDRNGHVHILANQKARCGKGVHRYLYIDLRNSW